MAHCNTIFGQMLKLIPRHQFASLEKQYGTGRAARTFSRWDQFVHLLFMPLTGRVSLRDGIAGLKARVHSLYHLGVHAVARATFADAHNRRPASFLRLYAATSTSAANRPHPDINSSLTTNSTA